MRSETLEQIQLSKNMLHIQSALDALVARTSKQYSNWDVGAPCKRKARAPSWNAPTHAKQTPGSRFEMCE